VLHLPEHDAGALGGRAGRLLGRADHAAHQAGPALQHPPRHADRQACIDRLSRLRLLPCPSVSLSGLRGTGHIAAAGVSARRSWVERAGRCHQAATLSGQPLRRPLAAQGWNLGPSLNTPLGDSSTPSASAASTMSVRSTTSSAARPRRASRTRQAASYSCPPLPPLSGSAAAGDYSRDMKQCPHKPAIHHLCFLCSLAPLLQLAVSIGPLKRW